MQNMYPRVRPRIAYSDCGLGVRTLGARSNRVDTMRPRLQSLRPLKQNLSMGMQPSHPQHKNPLPMVTVSTLARLWRRISMLLLGRWVILISQEKMESLVKQGQELVGTPYLGKEW